MTPPSASILEFSRDKRCVRGADSHRYFCLTLEGETLVLPSRCPHRGGPLHLARFDDKTQALVCPWHQLRLRPAVLRRMALPTVTVGGSCRTLNMNDQQEPVKDTSSRQENLRQEHYEKF